tara:strand:+ start:275 stop:445 length:171 start_codon:yes stop_codon:yes gene_type:complete
LLTLKVLPCNNQPIQYGAIKNLGVQEIGLSGPFLDPRIKRLHDGIQLPGGAIHITY